MAMPCLMGIPELHTLHASDVRRLQKHILAEGGSGGNGRLFMTDEADR